jgi:hypothetical protein
MNGTDPLEFKMDRVQRLALVLGAVLSAASILGLFLNRDAFFESYLVAYLFWMGIALGSAAVLMLYHLTGGGWGLIVRRLLEAATRTLPLMMLFLVPLLFGLPYLYEWARPDLVKADEVLRHKSAYLNVPFFMGRMALYFAVWLTLAYLLNKWSVEQDRSPDPGLADRFAALSAPGLILYGLTATFASVDWVMSREPHWYSTVYGMIFMVGQVLTTLAFVIGATMMLSEREPVSAVAAPAKLQDLGNLMLAFVMLWAYLAFSQFLIIWSGNLPEEVIWYRHRLDGGWAWVALLLVVFHFAVPFLLLLSRRIKRRARLLGKVAIAMAAIRLLDLLWVVLPAHGGSSFHLHWLNLAVPIGMGGFWIAMFVNRLKTRPLVPVNDPQLMSVGVNHG